MENNMIDSTSSANRFKFVFFVSFRSSKDAIGLEMLEGLDKLCK